MVLTKRSAASEDENVFRHCNLVPRVFVPYCACRLNKFSRPLVKGNEDHKYDGGLTGFWFIFSAFAFSPFLIFLLQFTFFSSRIPLKASSRLEILTTEPSVREGGNFQCSEPFAQISEHSCTFHVQPLWFLLQTLVQEMPILVKKLTSEVKASASYGRLGATQAPKR